MQRLGPRTAASGQDPEYVCQRSPMGTPYLVSLRSAGRLEVEGATPNVVDRFERPRRAELLAGPERRPRWTDRGGTPIAFTQVHGASGSARSAPGRGRGGGPGVPGQSGGGNCPGGGRRACRRWWRRCPRRGGSFPTGPRHAAHTRGLRAGTLHTCATCPPHVPQGCISTAPQRPGRVKVVFAPA